MKHVIEVTEDDILEAKALRKARLTGRAAGLLSENCPVALAAKRVFGTQWVSVGDDELEVGVAGDWFGLPVSARRFIEAFDLGDGTEPFSFEVEG